MYVGNISATAGHTSMAKQLVAVQNTWTAVTPFHCLLKRDGLKIAQAIEAPQLIARGMSETIWNAIIDTRIKNATIFNVP
jgi:hypothetical protein